MSWFQTIKDKYRGLSKVQKRLINSALTVAVVKIMDSRRNRKGKTE